MRPARALCPSRLAGLVLLAITTATTGHYQGSLICQQPKTQVCLSWLVHSEELQNFNNAESVPSPHTRAHCGFRKMQAFSPNQKFFEVSQLNKNKLPKTLHCQKIILIGHFVDWVNINDFLGRTVRIRRQTFTPKGRYRGQTQSQYLAIDRGNGKDEGKAEAHSAADSSRASVSGNSGMGQAQSQTIYDPNCEDCYGRPQVEVENLKHPGSFRPAGNEYGQNTGSTSPDVNHGQGNYFPNHPGYNPSTSSGSQSPGLYGPKSKTDGYGGTGPNDNKDYPGIYGKPTSNNGNIGANNRPIDSGTNGYEPNNIGGYVTKNVPSNNYKNPGNDGSGTYRPIGLGTNSYLPNGAYDPVGKVTPNTNGFGNIYTSRYPNQGVGSTPGDSTGGGVYGPTGNSNRFGPGGTSTYDPAIIPNQGSRQGLGPGQTSGQRLGPSQTLGQGLGPGQTSGQGLGPGQLTGQGLGPGQLSGQGLGPGQLSGQRLGPGQLSGQGLGPGQSSGQGLGPGQPSGQGGEPSQTSGQRLGPGQTSGQGLRPGQGLGQVIGPGYGSREGLEPGQGSGQVIGPGQLLGPGQDPRGLGQGVIPGHGLSPGQGQGVGTDQGQGVGLGQGVLPGSGQGIGPQPGISHVIPWQKGAGDSQNRLPSTVGEYGPNQRGVGTEYGPYQRGYGTGYGPNQNNYGSVYTPVQNGLESSPFNRDTNWPMASGPYAGPGGSKYYCCFVPNTGASGNVYPNNGATGNVYPNNGATGNVYPNTYGGPNALQGQSNVPGSQLGNGVNRPNGATNQYETSNGPSISQLPISQYGSNSGKPFSPGGHLGTDISNSPTTGIQYRPGGSRNTLTQPNPYGSEFDTNSPLKPGGPLGTGIYSDPNVGSQYGPDMGSGIQPNHYGTEIDAKRPLNPSGQFLTGVSHDPTVGSPYGPSGRPSNLPNGQIGFDSGPSMPGSQYTTNVGNVPHQQHGIYNPNEQNEGRGAGNSGIYNGQPVPGGQYNNGVNGGISPGQYGSGNDPRTNLPGSQYNRRIDGTPIDPYRESQNVPGTQIGPGVNRGQQGAQFGPVANSGLTSPGQQYGTNPNILDTYPAGRPPFTGPDQNESVGSDTVNYPGSPYGAGSLEGPKKSQGLGTTGPNSPTGNSGEPNAQGQPYGSDRVNLPSYGNGNINYNSNRPGGTYPAGNIGRENGGLTNGQGGGIPTNNGSPIDGTTGSRYGPYNSGGTGVQNNEYSGGPQNYIDPNSIDGDDSEAEASVAQGINGTIASASSKGGNDKGRAQTNVHGTYTGSGSFQAQAQITGDNKQAQSEVSGGKKGASSTASGSGRNNKSQASVQLGSETGSVQTQSQSAGVMHSSNSQVQGSVKGGMADAQAKGPGSTSSQAQIGFTPYKDADKSSHDLQKTPFAGGGVASAQSSGRTGQSQSQLHGTFKYGITYNGAAQSGASLDKDAVFPNRLSFEKIDVFDENEKNVNVDVTETPKSLINDIEPHVEPSSTSEPYDFANETEITTTENVIDAKFINSEVSHTHLDHHKTDDSYLSGPTLSGAKKSFSTNRINDPGRDYEFSTVKDELSPEADYDTDEPFNPDGSEETDLAQGEYSNYDEFTRESPTHQSLLSANSKPLEVRQSTGGNTQHIVLGSLKNHNAEIIQKNSDRPDENKVYLAGERIPGTGGYTVPAGFTGSVKSVSSKDNTYVVGYRDSPSQAQTVTLTPGTGKVKYMYPPAYGKHVMPKNLRSLYSPKDDNKYLSVSKSVARALDNENNIRKQYSHTYYTKSSSCGYFTFTCTMVSSAEGRKKVCKPKIPTNPDGTPIRC